MGVSISRSPLAVLSATGLLTGVKAAPIIPPTRTHGVFREEREGEHMPRRIAACCALAAAFLTLPVACHADEAAAQIVSEVQQATQKLHSLTADLTYTLASGIRTQRIEAGVKLMRPNYTLVTLRHAAGSPYARMLASDGKKTWTYSPKTKRYTSAPADPRGLDFHFLDSVVVGAFFDVPNAISSYMYAYGGMQELDYEGTVTQNGVEYRVLTHRLTGTSDGEATAFRQRLYVGPDNLIHKYVLYFGKGDKEGVQVAELSNIRKNPSLQSKEFAFKPVADRPVAGKKRSGRFAR